MGCEGKVRVGVGFAVRCRHGGNRGIYSSHLCLVLLAVVLITSLTIVDLFRLIRSMSIHIDIHMFNPQHRKGREGRGMLSKR